jgi:hypothetical protein
MLRCRTDSVKLLAPGGPVSRDGSRFATSAFGLAIDDRKNVSSKPSQIGFGTNLAVRAVVACSVLQHGKSPQPFDFSGDGARCRCIGQLEGIPSSPFARCSLAGAASTQ